MKPFLSTHIASFATAVLISAALLTGCASSGPSSPSARPVFYPNATLNRVGEAQAQRETDQCIGNAQRAGLSPDEKSNAVGRGAAKGAAVGGVASAVGALIRGRGVEGALESGAAGAAVGGSAGAMAGSFNDKPSSLYRNYVQRCLRDKGFDVIGWN